MVIRLSAFECCIIVQLNALLLNSIAIVQFHGQMNAQSEKRLSDPATVYVIHHVTWFENPWHQGDLRSHQS
jgi:hypothetical protein